MSLGTLAHVVSAIQNERLDIAATIEDNFEATRFYQSWTDEISAILVEYGHIATIRTVLSVHANGEDFEGFDEVEYHDAECDCGFCEWEDEEIDG